MVLFVKRDNKTKTLDMIVEKDFCFLASFFDISEGENSLLSSLLNVETKAS